MKDSSKEYPITMGEMMLTNSLLDTERIILKESNNIRKVLKGVKDGK